MKCPICQVGLAISERQGVEIDYCPQCRGVWLDRGELDKLIEKSSAAAPEPAMHRNESHDRHDHEDYRYKKKKKHSLLGEIFDF